ncbi:MAG: hypothetical protein JF616_18140 [Fibrobacteres bacterium]|nr:hypothetical protein [Fibrobacterota bacterium]
MTHPLPSLALLTCAGISAWGAPAWRAIEFTEPNPVQLSLSACKGDSLWATTPGDQRFSGDGGATWSVGWPLSDTSSGDCKAPAVFQGDTLTVKNPVPGRGYVWRHSGKDSVLAFDFRGNFRNLVATSNGILAVTRGGISFFSADGRNWNPITEGTRAADIRGLAANGSMLAAQTSLGLYLSRDRGRQWEYLRRALPSMDVPHLLLTQNHLFSCDVAKGFFRYDLTRKVWDTLSFPQQPELFSFATGNDRIVYGGDGPEGRGIYLSKDGAGFKRAGSFPRAVFYAMDVLRNDIVFIGKDSVFRTPDSGATWTRALGPCLDLGVETAATDSGLFVLDPIGFLRITGPKGCNQFAGPSGSKPYGTRNDEPGFRVAGEGGSVYLSGPDGLSVWEDAENVGLKRALRAVPTPPQGIRSPVRVWSAPSAGHRGLIDAKGASRKE